MVLKYMLKSHWLHVLICFTESGPKLYFSKHSAVENQTGLTTSVVETNNSGLC